MNTQRSAQCIPVTELDAVIQPISQAVGMPNAAYTDPALFEFERDHVMANTWAAIAFTSELPLDSFAIPVDFMGLPLAVVRNRQGEYHVFHNVCSHRGMPLVKEAAKIEGSIRCRYHSWTYDLNGRLKGTPHIGGIGVHKVEGFNCAQHNLREVRSAVWLNMVFVNLSGNAEEFEQFIAPLVERWSGYVGDAGLAQLQLAETDSSMELEIEANWKLAVENYCEAYHLPWVHPALNSYSPLDQHFNIVLSEQMSGQGTYNYSLSEVAGTSLPQFTQWPADKARQGEYISLYPNVLLGVQVDHAFAIILQPLAENRTLEKLELYYVGEEAGSREYSACRWAVLESWRVVFSEDVFAVEGMQAGRESPGFTGGVFSPVLDGPTHHFHSWVAQQYKTHSGAK